MLSTEMLGRYFTVVGMCSDFFLLRCSFSVGWVCKKQGLLHQLFQRMIHACVLLVAPGSLSMRV